MSSLNASPIILTSSFGIPDLECSCMRDMHSLRTVIEALLST